MLTTIRVLVLSKLGAMRGSGGHNEAIRLNPEHAKAYNNKGNVLAKPGAQ